MIRLLQAFARAKLPGEVAAYGLRKDNGKVRGAVPGSVIRLLASKAVVVQ